MKPSFWILTGFILSLSLLGAGCPKRNPPESMDQYRNRSSQLNGAIQRDQDGNLLLPSSPQGKMMDSGASGTMTGMRPLNIGPDGKGPTSTPPTTP